MSDESDFIVIRAPKGIPAGSMPPGLDGTWFDRAVFSFTFAVDADPALAVPTGRFEVREWDGAVAEVWEFQP